MQIFKKKTNKILFLFATLTLLFSSIFVFSACDTSNNDGKIHIVCTIFPEYDWAKNVIGESENIELTLLVDNGTDLHSYGNTVSTKDLVTISTADVFIYVGGESDEWVSDALKNAVNKNMVVINLLEVLGDNAKEEEIKEGMQTDEHNYDADEEETEYDEHVWLSLKNAKIFVNEFAKTIGNIDAQNKDIYLENANSYVQKLDALDSQYQQAVEDAQTKALLFGDRFPFRYLVDDYGLDYYAAFAGCEAESEASFETVIYLANKVDELGLKVILKIETSDGSVATSIKNATQSKNQQILTLDSIQSTTTKSGKTYLSIMTSNLDILKQAIK